MDNDPKRGDVAGIFVILKLNVEIIQIRINKL